MAVIPKAAYKCSSRLDSRRPKGGLALLVPKVLRSNVTTIYCDNWRIQAAILSISNIKLLIINLYLPCDTQRGADSCLELLETLSDIENLISNQNHYIMIQAGDWNAELSRPSNHVAHVTDYWRRNNLKSVCDDIDFTHNEEILEHFVMSNHWERPTMNQSKQRYQYLLILLMMMKLRNPRMKSPRRNMTGKVQMKTEILNTNPT